MPNLMSWSTADRVRSVTGLWAVAPAAAVVMSLATPAMAQPREIGPGPVERPDWSTRVELNGEYMFRTDNKNNNGDVGIARAGLEATVVYFASENVRLSLQVGTEYSHYSFKNTALLPNTTIPFNDMYSGRIDPGISFKIDEKWSVLATGLLGFAGEAGASAGDSFRAGGLAAARYSFNDKLAVSGGVLVQSRLEDGVLVVPIAGIEWQINDQLKLESRGLGLNLTAKINDDWKFVLNGEYQTREYRLEESSPLPSGVIRDKRAAISGKFVYTVDKRVELNLKLGAFVYQEIQADDRNGFEVATVKAKPGLFVGCGVTLRF